LSLWRKIGKPQIEAEKPRVTVPLIPRVAETPGRVPPEGAAARPIGKEKQRTRRQTRSGLDPIGPAGGARRPSAAASMSEMDPFGEGGETADLGSFQAPADASNECVSRRREERSKTFVRG
jgi:hypothetical protein